MSTASPEPATGGREGRDASARTSPPSQKQGSEPAGATGLLCLVVAVVAAYSVLWLLGQGPLAQLYTAEWASRRIAWLFAPVTLTLAIVYRRVLPPALSIIGLMLGVFIGELLGARSFALETARLERDLATGSLQAFEPSHPGWWIASLVFVALSVVGARIASRSRARRPR